MLNLVKLLESRGRSIHEEATSRSIIFDRRQPQTSYKQLENHARKNVLTKCFLIRESREKGMLTVDYIEADKSNPGEFNHDSLRFAFVKDQWITVYGSQIEDIRSIMSSTTTNNIAKRAESLYARIKEAINFDVRTKYLLKPIEVERSKQNAYSAYSLARLSGSDFSDDDLDNLIRTFDEMLCCGISDEPITDDNFRDAVVTPHHHVYLREYIVAWLEKRGTDPQTRFELDVEELMPISEIWLRLKVLMESKIAEKENRLNASSSMATSKK